MTMHQDKNASVDIAYEIGIDIASADILSVKRVGKK